MAFGFRHFDGDPRSMQDLGDKMIPWMEDHFDLTSEGYEISPLTQEDLDGAGVDKSIDGVVIGVVAGVDYHHPIEDVIVGMTWDDQGQIFEHYVDFDRRTEDDVGCFLDGECEFFHTQESIHSAPGGGLELWSDFTTDFRRIELEDGTPVLLQRILGTDPVEFNVDWVEIHQSYGFSYLYVREDGNTRRVQAIWADGEVAGTDAADGVHLTLAISNIKSAAEDLNAWLEDHED